MPKNNVGDVDDFTISETGNWNVADSFAQLKIMKPMINCEVYEDLSIYGFDSFSEELMNYDIPHEELRAKGLLRLINELMRLIKNTRFAMKRDKTEEEMDKFHDDLKRIRDEVFPHTYKPTTNHGTKVKGVKLIEPLFTKTLEAVSKIKSDMNSPLNRNHLIFVDKEEFDPKAFKERIKERMINKG